MDWISWWPDVFRNVLFKTEFCCIKYQQIGGQLSVGNSRYSATLSDYIIALSK